MWGTELIALEFEPLTFSSKPEMTFIPQDVGSRVLGFRGYLVFSLFDGTKMGANAVNYAWQLCKRGCAP